MGQNKVELQYKGIRAKKEGCRRFAAVVLSVVLAWMGSSCTKTGVMRMPWQSLESTPTTETASQDEAEPLRGVWISYLSLDFSGLDELAFQKQIDQMFQRVQEMGLNAVVVQVRPFADALYPSSIFPFSRLLTGRQGVDPGYDPLAYMVSAAHARKLSFHAWVNPFRVLSDSTDWNQLCQTHPVYGWMSDGDPSNDHWAVAAAGGLYLNPAVPQVQELILDGVREIVSRYEVDGVQIDDYFYPTTDASFDREAYAAYQESAGTSALGLSDWRRTQISGLVGAMYRTVHRERSQAVFGVSPSANQTTNYETLYADVSLWASRDGYVDYIAPQCYFGFSYSYQSKNQSFDFASLAKDWSALVKAESVQLYVGLGLYKAGTVDRDSLEWTEQHDIITRQVAYLQQQRIGTGWIVYSYRELERTEEAVVAERENLKNFLIQETER